MIETTPLESSFERISVKSLSPRLMSESLSTPTCLTGWTMPTLTTSHWCLSAGLS